MFKKQLTADEYISMVLERLKEKKYHIKNNVVYDNQTFMCVANRTAFERERLGSFFNTVFLFARFDKPDLQILKDFSRKSYKYAKKKYRNLYLPPILFWGLKCFPVAIVDSLDKEADDTIRFKEPKRHFGSFEKLVVFDLRIQTLIYYQLFNTWSILVDELDRKVIREMLSPNFI